MKKKTLTAARVQGKRRTAVLKNAPKRKKPSKPVTKARSKKATAKPSVEELLQKVNECVENFEHDVALHYCETALAVAPSNVEVLETTGGLLLEMGDIKRAIECFSKAVDISPDEGHRKYLCLGQLSEGQEAVKLLLKGVDIMAKQFHCQGTSASSSALCDITALDMSTAYCSLAEVYLTDCCFDDNAENKCGEYCSKALHYSDSNPDAYQLMGSYLLSKQECEKARTTLLQGLSLWLPTNQGDDGAGIDLQQVPSYQSQVNWAKLLMEVEEYQNAHLVLDQLLREDDEVVEVWYLLGWLAHLEDELPSAVDCLTRCKELYTACGCVDEQLLVHVEEMLEELGDVPAASNNDDDQDVCSSNDEMDTNLN